MEHNITKILESQPIFGDTQRHFRCCATSHIPPHCLYQTQPKRASSSDCYSLSPLLPTIKNGDRPTDAAGTRTSCPANASQITLAPATRQRAHPSRTRVPSGHPRARTEGGLAATGTGSNRGGLTIDERSAVTIDARYNMYHEICSYRNISTCCAESRTDLRRLLGKERRRRRGNAASYPVREWGCFLFFVNAGRDGTGVRGRLRLCFVGDGSGQCDDPGVFRVLVDFTASRLLACETPSSKRHTPHL